MESDPVHNLKGVVKLLYTWVKSWHISVAEFFDLGSNPSDWNTRVLHVWVAVTCLCLAPYFHTTNHPGPGSLHLLHQHPNHSMSHIEDPKQLSLRTAQLSNNVLGINAPPSPANKSAPADLSVHYTCFIRLPFARGDFVDPPQVG